MQIRFSLHISSELHWNVCIGGVMIEADILNALPRALSSAASLVEVINTLSPVTFVWAMMMKNIIQFKQPGKECS
jgi:hypothetical protein